MKVCTKCGVEQNDSQFYFDKKKSYRIARCNSCQSAAKQAYKEANRDRLASANLEWQRNNRTRTRAAQERWKSKNPELAAERARIWYRSNKERASEREAQKRRCIKDAAFKAYGGYECACCGEKHPAFLTIDHVDENGSFHRRSDSKAKKLYTWLKMNQYPTGYQVLCMNCNWAKSRNGGICPHKTTEGSTTS